MNLKKIFRIINIYYFMFNIINVCCVNVNIRVVFCFMFFIFKVLQGVGNVGVVVNYFGFNFISVMLFIDLFWCVLYLQCM